MSPCKIGFLLMALVLPPRLGRSANKPGEISFRIVQGFGIVVQGEIGSMPNMNFLVDTGAVPSVLGQRAASQMGIRGVRGSLSLLDKDTRAEYVTVGEVHVGWVRAAQLSMVVVDLAHLEQRLGMRIDGILGLDIFAGQDITIDYRLRKITRGLSGQPRHALAAETYSLAGAPYWVLPISLGGETLRLLLDTGADGVGLFAQRVPKPFKRVRGERIAHHSATGEVEAIALAPMTLVLSDGKFKNQPAVVIGEAGGGLQEVDGVLGPRALGITRIELDWERKCLRWDMQ